MINQESAMKSIRKFFPFIRPHLDKLLMIWSIEGVSMVISLVAPLITRLTIDHAYLARNLEVFNSLIIAGLILFILDGYLDFIKDYLGARTENLIALSLSKHNKVQL